MKAIILKPGNIFSGDRQRAVFTNPTELAFRKGNLKHHYPVRFRKTVYADAEAAYQHNSKKLKADYKALQFLVVEILIAKFEQYPILYETIVVSGGTDWIRKCDHFVHARSNSFRRWEGRGMNSDFIACLLNAFQKMVKSKISKSHKLSH